MGPAPSLSSYQKAAQSIYAPQQAAEARTLATNEQNTINTLESGKGQISADYQSAIDNLNTTLNADIGKINQLYTERLGGNFSGLQGNDLGGLFSSAQKQQSNIEQTRANKLAEITVGETNAKNTYNTDVTNLPSKYQSLQAQYAQGAYGSAVKDYQTQAYRQAQLQQAQERINISANRSSAAKTPSQGEVKQADASTIGSFLNSVVGKDGHVNQQNWNQAMKQWVNAGYSAKEFVANNMQFINQRYSGYHGFS
jgi:hypothetical protein